MRKMMRLFLENFTFIFRFFNVQVQSTRMGKGEGNWNRSKKCETDAAKSGQGAANRVSTQCNSFKKHFEVMSPEKGDSVSKQVKRRSGQREAGPKSMCVFQSKWKEEVQATDMGQKRSGMRTPETRKCLKDEHSSSCECGRVRGKCNTPSALHICAKRTQTAQKSCVAD